MSTPVYSEGHIYPLQLCGNLLVVNTFGCHLTVDEETQGVGLVRAAVDLINTHRGALPQDVLAALAQVQEIILTASDSTDLGDTGRSPVDGRRTITLSLAYIIAASIAWLASVIAHEGQHYLNHGKYSGADLWMDEQSAGATQLKLGVLLGLSDAFVTYLKSWIAPTNSAAMEKHMDDGYAGPPLPASETSNEQQVS